MDNSGHCFCLNKTGAMDRFQSLDKHSLIQNNMCIKMCRGMHVRWVKIEDTVNDLMSARSLISAPLKINTISTVAHFLYKLAWSVSNKYNSEIANVF